MLKQKNSPECCYSCKEPPYISYKFKIIKNNNSSPPKKSSNNKDYCHRMCPECLIRYIFIKNITLFEKPSKEFYELLIKRIWHNAEEILFIDDQEENIQNAENFGLKAIYYQKNTILSETILSYLSKIE